MSSLAHPSRRGRHAILIRAKGDFGELPSATQIAEYFVSKGFDVKTSILNLDNPHQVVQVCGAIVKFASGQWNGTTRIGERYGELEGGVSNGEKHEYSSIREWWKNEGSKATKKMLSQMWKPNEQREDSGPKT